MGFFEVFSPFLVGGKRSFLGRGGRGEGVFEGGGWEGYNAI